MEIFFPIMKNCLAALLLLFAISAYAQKVKPVKITYQKINMGKPVGTDNPVVIFCDADKTLITSKLILEGKAGYPNEQTLVNHSDNTYTNFAQLGTKEFTTTIDTTSIRKQTFELLSETKTILGYKCNKAKTIINSNTIELWYINQLKVKGSPTILGQDLGLVLEIVRNNDYVIRAEKIETVKNVTSVFEALPKNVRPTDALTYRDKIWKARFVTLPVFQDEIINFSDKSKSNDSILRFANGTIALRKIKFPEIKPGSRVFAELTEQSNGDAYDRTGSVFIIPADRTQSFFEGLTKGVNSLPAYENGNGKKYHGVTLTENYLPVLELMRFFTPFGIKQYNHIQLKDKAWHAIVPYRQDVTELSPLMSNKELWVGVFVGNYDNGGHRVNLDITIHPDSSTEIRENFVLPIFNTTNVMEMAGQEYATMFDSPKGLEVRFTLTRAVKNARLRYITTGHGGWENGDEFVPKPNTILLDGRKVFSFIPWRQDCGSYRLFNPASGNFENGLSSSDYSRSNWCPGTLTNPEYIELGDLAVGEHTITVRIPQGKPEGNSFSSWNVSGVLLGEE
ncbi:MAG: GLPGLI family protein [Flavobacterium sp.]